MTLRVCGAVILAAGKGRRFGADKRLARLADSTVAETTLALYAQIFDRVRVIVRSNDDPLEARLNAQEKLEFRVASHAHLGMGHSLAAGFADLQWDFAFVGMADMPFVRADTLTHLREIAAAKRYANIVRPHGPQNPRTGHPVGFPPTTYPALVSCAGDIGAREVLRKHAHLIHDVVISDPGIYRDIDTPQDLPPV